MFKQQERGSIPQKQTKKIAEKASIDYIYTGEIAALRFSLVKSSSQLGKKLFYNKNPAPYCILLPPTLHMNPNICIHTMNTQLQKDNLNWENNFKIYFSSFGNQDAHIKNTSST